MTFDAPWSTTLKVISGLTTALMIGMAVLFMGILVEQHPESLIAGITPLIVLIGALPFTIRGYELSREGLRIQRLMWSTHIPLDDLKKAWSDPDAMKRSIRLFGNGGLFSFTGLYRNKALGNFRAFATDPRSSVVLDLGDRKVVVTPDRPSHMVRKLKEMWPSIEVGEPSRL